MTVRNCIHILSAFLLVAVTLFYTKHVFSLSVPVKIRLINSAYKTHLDNPSFVCWISPDRGSNGIEGVISRLPYGCDTVEEGLILHTYVGHQFVVLQPNRTLHNPIQIITAVTKEPVLDIQKSVNYNSTTDFDFIVEWQKIMLLRTHIHTTTGMVLFIAACIQAYICRTSIKKKKKHSKTLTTVYTTIVPRTYIKSYAVVTMLLNHIGHVFLPSTSLLFKPMLITLADTGGSLHIFNWLIGYNTATTGARSSEAWLLGAFLFLHLFVSLPPPISYETLLSISVTRWIFSTGFFKVDAAGNCKFADAPIHIHAVICSALFLIEIIVGETGLMIVLSTGVLCAACGRLFVINNVDNAKRYLWIFACTCFTTYSMRYYTRIVYKDLPIYTNVYIVVFCVLSFVHIVSLNWRSAVANKPAHSTGMVYRMASFLSRYSLEIYVGHFVVFKIITMLV